MRVVFHIPGPLREFTGGESRVAFDGSLETVGQALAALWHLYPGLRCRIIDEQENVREHVNIFVGEDSIRHTGGLRTPLKEECEIFIIPAISGG